MAQHFLCPRPETLNGKRGNALPYAFYRDVCLHPKMRNSSVLVGPGASKHIGRERGKRCSVVLSHQAFGGTLRWAGGAKLAS